MNEDDRLAGLLEFLDICSLRLRELDGCPVSTLEAFEIDPHFFALELWRKTSDKDDRVYIIEHRQIDCACF